ncbi:hypothetical protein HN803_04380 [candidate division WWE3 bacterium]|jgi:hypothetical protein|nr:hypothetical protein [candidate division WWE3 bacterium]
MSKSDKMRKAQAKKRKNKERRERLKNKNLFSNINGVDSTENAFYALQGNADYTQILDKADKAFVKSQNKETRDRALNHLVRCMIANGY